MRTIIAALLGVIFLTSCKETIRGNGVTKQDARAVQAFDEIEVSGQVTVYLRQGETEEVIVEADENLLPYIETKVSGDRLSISAEADFKDYKKLDVYITARALEFIRISGAVELKGERVFRSDDLKVDASGACMVNMELQCEELAIDGSGAVSFNLKGFSREVDYDISGAVEVNAFELETRNTKLDMSGAGRADIYVTDEVRMDVSGAGEVNYKGNPREIKQDISGAASINQIK